MKTSELLTDCISYLSSHLEEGTTLDLFKKMYPYPLDDADNIVFNIQRMDEHVKENLIKKVDRALMDEKMSFETQGEAFIYRLRLENAIRTLTILSKAKVSCEISSTISEECLCWALTSLWSVSGIQWAYRTAQAFCEGQPSALPWPLPV